MTSISGEQVETMMADQVDVPVDEAGPPSTDGGPATADGGATIDGGATGGGTSDGGGSNELNEGFDAALKNLHSARIQLAKMKKKLAAASGQAAYDQVMVNGMEKHLEAVQRSNDKFPETLTCLGCRMTDGGGLPKAKAKGKSAASGGGKKSSKKGSKKK